MAINFPDPAVENPWVDPNGDLWEHDGDGWSRVNLDGGVEEPLVLSGRQDAVWTAIVVREAPLNGQTFARQDATWIPYASDVVGIFAITGESGMVFDFAGSVPPSNAYECKSQEIPKADQPDLYAAIGDVWANTNGAPNPDPANFRLPPRVRGGLGIYDCAGDVGNGFDSRNLSHNHTMDHNHNGDTSSGGVDHYHSEVQYASNGNGSGPIRIDDYSGSENSSVSTNTDGDHTHDLTVDNDNTVTGSQGGNEFRPQSVTVMKCIWK